MRTTLNDDWRKYHKCSKEILKMKQDIKYFALIENVVGN